MNHDTDLAVIKIDEHNLPFIPLPFEFNVRLGQTVIAIAAPQGLDHTVSKSILSAVGRQHDADSPMVYVQTDATHQPRNSGGPLIDRNGNLVGINTFIDTSGGEARGSASLPEPVVRFVYNEIKSHGIEQSVTIDAHAQAITLPLADAFKLPQKSGVILSDVQPGGPAERAGLQPKDIVISADGVPIDSLPRYAASFYLHWGGTPMTIEVLRGDRTVDLPVTPVEMPTTLDNLSDFINPRTDLIAPLDVFAVEDFPGRSKNGAVVASLLNGESAIAADLQVGDVLLAVNSKGTSGNDELRQQLGKF